MSASPADRTPGRTPNGGVAPRIRRPKPADPMVRPKDRNKQRAQRPPTTNGISGSHPNGLSVPGQGQTQTMPQHPGRPVVAPPQRPSPGIHDEIETINSGFTSPAIAPFTDYPLVTTKRELREGLRYHVAKFYSKKIVDPRNSDEFTPPVRLHRRDPRAPAGGGGGVKDEDAEMGGMDGDGGVVDDKERERQEIARAQRDAEREAEMAQVAPSANTGGQKKLNAFKKKTQQIYRNDQTDEQKAGSKLRYEEALPWHLEDFDNKSTWVGSYEAALSETYAMLVQGADGAFRMVPLEKWYKFTSKNQFKSLTIEEAEARLNKKMKEPRWSHRERQAEIEKKTEQANKNAGKKLFLGKWEPGSNGTNGPTAATTKGEHADADDIDYDDDEQFADDEENPVLEGENEDLKEATQRIKRDQQQANIFGLKEEREYEKQEEMEKKEKEREKKLGKDVRRALKKIEKKHYYNSDSDENPYASKSESDDTETERLKEEERKNEVKTEDGKKTTSSDREKPKPSKPSSDSSSKGTNTPSRNPTKKPNLLRKPSSNALKRPGSPNLSEASGTESSRKKHKKQHAGASSIQSQPSNLQPPSRSMSPSVPPASSPPVTSTNKTRPSISSQRKSVASPSHAGSGSDAEMSDGTRKRVKLKLSQPASKNGSPQGSRAGSPDRGTPKTQPAAPDPNQCPFPTAHELRTKVPLEGIKVGDLLAHFKGAVVGGERKARFTKLMRENSRYDKVAKLLKPLDK